MARSRSKVGKMAKRKGNARELWVAHALTAWWGSKFRRTPQSGGSALAADYHLAGDVATQDRTFPFHVEVKNQEGWHVAQLFTSGKCRPWKWWAQATREALDGDAPLMVFKRNRQPAWIMMENSFYDAHQGDVPGDCILLIDPEGVEVIVFLFDVLLASDPKEWSRE